MNLSILMKKAGTLKSSAALRQYTPLVTITENVTQWSSQFTMVNALASLMLSCVEVTELQTAFQNMTKFNQVTAALQRQGKYVKYFIMCLKTIPISKIALPLIHKLCMTIV
jgi:NADH:ubiquinone oxidoreductase subunit B-like Fe-S oxidoreductase